MVEIRRRVMRLNFIVSDLVTGEGAELSAFYSDGRLGHWPYVLREKVTFSYGIDYKFGSFVYVAGGNLFEVEDLVEFERGPYLRMSSVFVA